MCRRGGRRGATRRARAFHGHASVLRGVEVALANGAPLLVQWRGRAADVRAVELEVDPGHEPARALYRAWVSNRTREPRWCSVCAAESDVRQVGPSACTA